MRSSVPAPLRRPRHGDSSAGPRRRVAAAAREGCSPLSARCDEVFVAREQSLERSRSTPASRRDATPRVPPCPPTCRSCDAAAVPTSAMTALRRALRAGSCERPTMTWRDRQASAAGSFCCMFRKDRRKTLKLRRAPATIAADPGPSTRSHGRARRCFQTGMVVQERRRIPPSRRLIGTWDNLIEARRRAAAFFLNSTRTPAQTPRNQALGVRTDETEGASESLRRGSDLALAVFAFGILAGLATAARHPSRLGDFAARGRRRASRNALHAERTRPMAARSDASANCKHVLACIGTGVSESRTRTCPGATSICAGRTSRTIPTIAVRAAGRVQ